MKLLKITLNCCFHEELFQKDLPLARESIVAGCRVTLREPPREVSRIRATSVLAVDLAETDGASRKGNGD